MEKPEEDPLTARRVLIVEDEIFVALGLELLVLKKAPAAQVVVCASVAEARQAAVDPVGLALLDIDVLDGETFEVAEALKRTGTPILFVPASKAEDVPPALADVPFGANPYRAPAIESAIEAALREGDRASRHPSTAAGKPQGRSGMTVSPQQHWHRCGGDPA